MEYARSNVKAVIRLDNLRRNIEIIKSRIGEGIGITAIVKADAYGHGAVEISRKALESGASMLAVATVCEGVELREAGIDAPILVLSRGEQYETAVKYSLTEAVFDSDEARLINEEAKKLGKIAKIHIKLNTGMSRLGFDAFDENTADKVYEISQLENIKITGIFSHYATGDMMSGAGFAKLQFERFMKAVSAIESKGIKIANRHICNSGGIFNHPETHLDSVRAGIALYGGEPDDGNSDYGLLPVMELKANIIAVRNLHPGETVSYGRHYKADSERRIAVVGAGYADGYSRHLSSKSDVLILGKRAPVVGNICMDVFMVDITYIPEANVGDTVILIGQDGDEKITIEELANLAGTINHEILVSVSKRVPREYVG